MKNKTTVPYKARVIVRGNTGSRVLRSEKEKQMSRAGLKRQLRKELSCLSDYQEFRQFTSVSYQW